MTKAFYRKYRSRKLSEVVGQEHITTALEQALKSGKISHAYLLTGPRGVGKTSVARILAHEINKLPYTDDSAHIDIVEIDAASNRRIDEIRDLREKVYVAPVSAPYKVYIIDEVHMLTREAFNALLKTLEEPPAHVVFILATTDPQKLPETIVSRTQRFSFRPVAKDKVVAHLRQLAKQEGITVQDEALELLAQHGEGSFRDSISLLDQVSHQGQKLTDEIVRDMLGIPAKDKLEQLYKELAQSSSASLMQLLNALYDAGYTAPVIAKEFSDLLREKLLLGSQSLNILTLLERLLEVTAATDPARLLEIILLQAQPASPAVVSGTSSKAVPSVTAAPAATKSKDKAEPKPPVAAQPLNLATWANILSALKQRHNTLYGVVRMAEPEFIDDRHLRLGFAFAFHQKRINEAANRQLLAAIIKELTGVSVSIECVNNKQATPPKLPINATKTTEAPANTASFDAISNIFGGGELLES